MAPAGSITCEPAEPHWGARKWYSLGSFHSDQKDTRGSAPPVSAARATGSSAATRAWTAAEGGTIGGRIGGPPPPPPEPEPEPLPPLGFCGGT